MSIYDLISKYRKENKSLVLVTAVAKEGSGPVEVGKKMIYLEDGTSIGTVGGGALELFAKKKCVQIMAER
ncbi:MAG TPA: XdhC family protein, partial [Bacillota bacterium]|nr:XdhC family protein [Bacillota bacterium]